ncbi:MAG TPA: D-2-hydroxyacid dehydrogenase [Phycisphaeraceae bacterium]
MTAMPTRVAVIDKEESNLAEQLAGRLGPAVQVLDATAHQVRDEYVREAQVLVTEAWLPEPAAAPRLQMIQLISAGYEHLDPAWLRSAPWPVAHAAGAAAVPIAEWCLGMMLHFGHRLDDLLARQRARAWPTDRIRQMSARVLHGRVVGIAGYGAVGRQVARLCQAMGMRICASLGRCGKAQRLTYTTPGTGDPEGRLPDHWFHLDALADVVGQLDYLILGLRHTPQTHGLINRHLLSRCKPGMVLINPARGGLINEADLIEALRSRRLGGAALDTFEHEPLPAQSPLWDAPNVVISPHCAPESDFFRSELVRCIAENVMRHIEGRPLLNLIDETRSTACCAGERR